MRSSVVGWSRRRGIVLLSGLIMVAVVCFPAPGWASTADRGSSQSRVISFESLGLTNPGGCSLLVDGDVANADFQSAVTNARSRARVVFVLGEAEDLLKAIPGAQASIGRPMGTMLTGGAVYPEKVVSYYATFPNRQPTIGIMTFKSFDGSYADLLASDEFQGFLIDVNGQYTDKLRRGSIPITVAMATELGPGVASAALAGGTWGALYTINWGESYPIYGRFYCDDTAEFLYGDTNPNYDYYKYAVGLTSRPGCQVWPGQWPMWQTSKHRFKFQAYGTGSTIAVASPSTTTGGQTVTVTLSYPAGVSATWQYDKPDISIYYTDARPSYVLWEHRYSAGCAAAQYSSCVNPGYVQQVPQGAAGQTYVNGTLTWYSPLYPGCFYSQNNVGNRVTIFNHP